MSAFHLTVFDNMKAFRSWHGRKHMGDWHECVYEPCNHMEPDFRKDWTP